MPPGRKRKPAPAPAEAPLTNYEKEKVATMMRNNQMLQSLGIPALSSLMSSSFAMGRGGASNRSKVHESEHSMGSEQDIAAKHPPAAHFSENETENELTTNTFKPAGSKRVMALEKHDPPSRMTRQKTKEQHTTEEALQGPATNGEDALMVADSPNGLDDQILICSEGQSSAMVRRPRGRTIGKELDRISRGLCTKIQVHVAEGKRRPEAPMQAAKLASECGIIIRNHLPILTHWKEYKKKEKEEYFEDYMGKIGAQFAIDIDDKAAKSACTDLLKSIQRQLRHKLKKEYFDDVPANKVPTTSPLDTMTDEQWLALVALWSSPKHKEKCAANKRNREKVRFPQRTGSRSYVVHANLLKQDEKYKDVEPNEIDLFRECHTSTNAGLSEDVREALVQMEAIVNEPVEEGQPTKTPAEAVAQVLSSKKFLQNVGIKTTMPKRNAKAADHVRVRELEAQVEAEKQGSAELREQVKAMQAEIERMKKQSEKTNAALRSVFGLNDE